MKSTKFVFRTFALSLLLTGALAQAAHHHRHGDRQDHRQARRGRHRGAGGPAGRHERGGARHHRRPRPLFAGARRAAARLWCASRIRARPTSLPRRRADAPADIAVYDVAAKVDGVCIDDDVIGWSRAPTGSFTSSSATPSTTPARRRRRSGAHESFEIVLPADAVVAGVSAQRPGGLPTSVKLDPTGAKGHFAFNFPIQPDDGDKGTLFQIEYELALQRGKLTFHPQVSIPAKTVWVMMPKSMTFAAGAGSDFQSSPQDPGFATYVAKNLAPGKSLEFTVSGTGSLPRDDQGGQTGQQSGGAMGGQDNGAQDTGTPGNQPGGGIGTPINTPDPLSKYKWWILGLLALIMVATAGFLLRKPQLGAAYEAAIPLASATPASKNAALLNVLKEELFALETEKVAGSIAPAEYAETKAALETVLRRALKKS